MSCVYCGEYTREDLPCGNHGAHISCMLRFGGSCPVCVPRRYSCSGFFKLVCLGLVVALMWPRDQCADLPMETVRDRWERTRCQVERALPSRYGLFNAKIDEFAESELVVARIYESAIGPISGKTRVIVEFYT